MPTPIKGRDKLIKEIKPKFIEHYKSFCPNYDKFIDYSFSYPRQAIRVNTLKTTPAKVKKSMTKQGWILKQVPWCKQGFFITHKEDRRDIGNTPEHALGYIFVQDAASMIPPLVLDPKPGETILDMCAAPGSKATQIAQYMKNKGVLIANDYKGIRLAALGINMQRLGITNNVITLMEGKYFKEFEFDRILVDAPCSGTGTIRKSLKTTKQWSINLLKNLSGIQRQLLRTAFENLKSGGTLVYSTCSCEPIENEAVVSWLLENYPNAEIENIKIKGLKSSPPIMEFDKTKYNPQVKNCLRIWPYDNDTEGFFVTKITKK
tara:strand:+ start:2224 stop:3180 length:957 start_codon:yes stop_codon:yes gene_type:complete